MANQKTGISKKAIPSTVGLKDVAEFCGVSASTVCRALNSRDDINSNTKEKIIQACDELGYTRNAIASNLRMKRTDTIACIMHTGFNEMAVEKVSFLKQAVIEKGYRFRYESHDTFEEAEELLSNALSERPAGVIIDFEPSPRLCNALKKNGIPTVSYDHTSKEFSSVTLNRPAGVKEAVNAMINAGRKRIILFGEGMKGARGAAYREVLTEKGLILDPELIWDEPFGRDLYVYGYVQGKKLIAERDFDAVQCVNDACAIGLIKALSETGKKVPEDVSVTGFDDIMPSRYQVPALSTVAQPKEEMAKKAVDLLFEQMKKPESIRHIVLETRFVDRDTI